MIGRLRGVLVSQRGTTVVLEVAGAGYEVAMTTRGVATFPGLGEEVVIHTHLHVREDGFALYGFPSEADRDLFRVLIGATGIGPKLAMAMLSALSAAELRRAVAAEDVDALTIVPGVGKRSAQKLILDLRPKLADAEADVLSTEPAQLRQALEGLGYTHSEIREISVNTDASAPLAEQLRAALRELGRG